MPIALITDKRVGMVIHILTASGAIAGLIALHFIVNNHIRDGLLWLIVCQILDGIDGPIARRYGASEHAHLIDGHVLDLIVDYVTCVVVPVVLLMQTRLVDRHATMFASGTILLTSALWFARTDQETDDGWFRGFPASWNIVIPSFIILGTSQRSVLLFTVLFCVLQMTTVEFPHILRAVVMRKMTISITVVYFTCFIWLSATYPNGPWLAQRVLLLAPIYLAFLVAWRTWAPERAIFGFSVT